MKTVLPMYVERICEGCGKPFQAKRKNAINYNSFCQDCCDKKIWVRSKRFPR